MEGKCVSQLFGRRTQDTRMEAELELITTRKVVYGILDFLDTEVKKPSTTSSAQDSLQVAIQCLETAYGVTIHEEDKEYQPERTLMELVGSASSIGASSNPLASLFDGSAGPNSLAALFAGSAVNPLEALADSNPLAALAQAFPFKFHTGEEYEQPPEASEADKLNAEELKNKGNDAMGRESFAEALEEYNQAIELDGNNAAYFCNRAATFIKLEQYDEARRDCQIAAQLDPSYARAYGRMGHTYSCQNKTVDAILCFKKALELEPENESYITNFQALQTVMQNDLPSVMAQAPSSDLIQAIFQNNNLLS